MITHARTLRLMTTQVPTSTARRHRSLVTIAAADCPEAHAAKEALARIEQTYPSLAVQPTPSLAHAKNWRHAVKLLITHYTDGGLCFSAGLIAREIRIARTDMVFSVRGISEFVDASASGFRYNGEPAVMVPRETTGLSRSRVGSTVRVYGPNEDLGNAFDFEVDIPRPGQLALAAGPGQS